MKPEDTEKAQIYVLNFYLTIQYVQIFQSVP